MKRKWLVGLTIILCLAFFISTINVSAATTIGLAAKKTPRTPGAQATLNALNKPTKPNEGKFENFNGVIESVNSTSLSLTLEDNSLVSFTLSGTTKIKIPTLGKNASIDDLQINQNVRVKAYQGESDDWIAVMVNVIPGKPAIVHHVGTVIAYTPAASITIKDKDGQSFTFYITADTKILPFERVSQLGVGSMVTIICPRNVTGGTLTAKGIVIHPVPEATAEPKEMEEPTEIPAL